VKPWARRMITHQVAGEDDLGALLEEELDGGRGCGYRR
jgi:hypothetical protein